jgi:hypothetical protein
LVRFIGCSKPVRAVGLLDDAVGLDAALAGTGMHPAGGEVRLDLGGDAIDHLDGEQIGPATHW